MMTFWQDIKYGIRVLLKSPGITFIAVLAIALGIGANTAIFSVVNSVLLRPLPFNKPEQLVVVWRTHAKRGQTQGSSSFLNFADYRAQNKSFEALAAYNSSSSALSGNETPEQVEGVTATAEFFKVLGTPPLLGRTFTPEDERPGGSPVVVISHGMWQRRFGADPGIIGRQITLDGRSKTIIGVLPESFRFQLIDDPPEYWLPMDPTDDMNKQRGANYLQVLGRLREGVTIQEAEAEMKGIAGRLEQQYQEENAGRSVRLVAAHEELVGELRPTLLVLLGAVAFVLLIACANVANLLLARAAGRGREIAIRTALGAGRRRIVRQLLTESVLLSVLGGALGLLIAIWGIDLLGAVVPADIPRFGETNLDFTVLGFTLGASILTGLIFGLAPALSASKIDLNEALKEGGRSATEGRGRNRMRSLLIISEVALSLVLLVGAGLLIKSFIHLRSVNPGFNADRVLTASLSLPSVKYKGDAQIAQFIRQATERVSRIPGVEAAGAIMPLPFSQNIISVTFSLDGQPEPPPGESPISAARIITPDYLRAMGIPLVRGRAFTAQDKADSPKVILINEALARKYFPGEDPVGRRLRLGLNDINGEIVGVIGDVRGSNLSKEDGPEFYVPHEQVTFSDMSMVVRTSFDDPARIVPALRAAIQEIDKDQPLHEVRTMNSLIADSVARQRFSMTLIALFAALALVLASVGIFSVMSFLVTQRTHEIGIRMALGAQTGDVLRMIVGQGMTFTLIGIVAGLAAAFALTRVIRGLLFGVSATDPWTFTGVALLLGVVALLACYIPARRATKVDPMVALRYE
ncbi:MAG TPA: ABC transporter permease [Pyrinomonadaceae bacterium]|jgi:putative ABC transport system permease protein|nr:ABC transporter permease [Pyrinomonadaceae bacterium]